MNVSTSKRREPSPLFGSLTVLPVVLALWCAACVPDAAAPSQVTPSGPPPAQPVVALVDPTPVQGAEPRDEKAPQPEASPSNPHADKPDNDPSLDVAHDATGPATPRAIPARCKLPPKTGPCRARAMMYYFDSKTSSCRELVYGGCQGNANRFESKQACLRVCKS